MRNVNASVRIVVMSVAVLAFWMLGAGIAHAHTELSSSDPAADASVGSPPKVITLTFTEDINSAFVNVVLTSADGRSWLSGDPRVDGPRVTATVTSDAPPAGLYTVGYRVVSADGHPVSGSYTFTIAGVQAAPPASTSAGASPPTTSAAPPTAAPAGADTKTSVITAAVAGLALGGVIVFWQSRKHRRRNGSSAEMGPVDRP